MVIGIDGNKALNVKNGSQSDVFALIECIADEYPSDKILVYTSKIKDKETALRLSKRHNIELRMPPPSGFGGWLWRHFGVSNNLQPDHVDLFHGPYNELPLNVVLAHVPTVVTMTGLNEILNSGCTSSVKSKYHQYMIEHACKDASVIIATDADFNILINNYPGISELNKKVIPLDRNLTGKELARFLMSVYQNVASRNPDS